MGYKQHFIEYLDAVSGPDKGEHLPNARVAAPLHYDEGCYRHHAMYARLLGIGGAPADQWMNERPSQGHCVDIVILVVIIVVYVIILDVYIIIVLMILVVNIIIIVVYIIILVIIVIVNIIILVINITTLIIIIVIMIAWGKDERKSSWHCVRVYTLETLVKKSWQDTYACTCDEPN